MKKRYMLCLGITILFIASVMFGVTVLKNLGKEYVPEKPKIAEKKKEKVYKTYDMYVSINPFVKLTFKAEYETCDDSFCFTGIEEIIDYELINDDAKTVYNELNFKGMQVMDVLILLCDTARANNIAYDSVSITTNWDDMYDDEVLKNEIIAKSKYEFNFDIFVDVKEYISDQEIIEDNENDEIVEFIVSFNRDNGDSIIKRKVKENELVTEIKPGNKSGYTFVEWQLNGKKYDFNTPITKDITLIAKWKKGESTTTTTTTNTPSGENTTQPIKSTTQTPSYTSTIDRINLNENILVTEESNGIYSGKGCGVFYGKYVFVTNASSVLGDYKDYGNTYVANQHISIKNINYDDYSSNDEYMNAYENACNVVVSDFNNKVGALVYDTAKENAATSVLEKLKNSKTRGINGFTYDVSGHEFSYSYKYLSMENAKSFGDFGKQFNQLNNISELNNAFKSITYISDYCMGGCGSSDYPEVKVLNETLCSKYNLNCDRW